MRTSLTIKEFSALLTSGKEDSPLLAALRRLATIGKVEEIVAAILRAQSFWHK